MSYILDALKRAESERNRGSVPGIHTPAPTNLQPTTHHRSATLARWLMGLGGTVLLGTLAWWLTLRNAPPPPTHAPSTGHPQGPATPTPRSLEPTSTPPAPAVAPPPQPVPTPTPEPAAALEPAPTPPARTQRPPNPPAAPPAKAQPPKPKPAPARTPAAPAPKEPPPSPPAGNRPPLPAVSVSGATYSENPLYRMVIVNGQVLHEGDNAGSGITLETIRAKEVVLLYQGHRYTVGY